MTDHKQYSIAVLLGGTSAEREVSLRSGSAVAAALSERGHRVETLDTADLGFIDRLREGDFDVVYISLHGRSGEDGTIQGMLEILGLPYTGPGVLASALAIDKVAAKAMFDAAGILNAESVVLRAGETHDPAAIVALLGEKVVVKPAHEGSSVGMSIVHNIDELAPAIDLAFSHDDLVLIEEFIAGTEATVGVLGTTDPFALPTLEVVPENEFYDYESKYAPGMSTHIIPARVSESAEAECKRVAVAAFQALGCRGVSRIDVIVTPDDEVYVLEVNTIPGMTGTSLLPDAAKAVGISFGELCEKIVGYALED